eukprot:TRINITY_DN16240_c0_g1_i1.p1 TRINITY_DN16240_c0_g1~~TRINITY_DN16240_c0_g1_i1.p1  ORF type:complete len:1018 (+),score=343.01 TRINITY_DN16240_c0_g1_i1:90-3056(+)
MPARSRPAKPAAKKGKPPAAAPAPEPVPEPAAEPKAVITKDTPNEPVVVGCEVGGVVDIRGKQGFVKYVGPVFFGEGTWVGIHFPSGADEWEDAMNGEVDGTRYFLSEEKASLFLPKDDVEREHLNAQMQKSEAAARECRAALSGPPVSLLSLSKTRDRFEGSQSRKTHPEKSHSLADSIATAQKERQQARGTRRSGDEASKGTAPAPAGALRRQSSGAKGRGSTGSASTGRRSPSAAPSTSGSAPAPPKPLPGAGKPKEKEREAPEARPAALSFDDDMDPNASWGGADGDAFGGWDDSSPMAAQEGRKRVLRHSVGYASNTRHGGARRRTVSDASSIGGAHYVPREASVGTHHADVPPSLASPDASEHEAHAATSPPAVAATAEVIDDHQPPMAGRLRARRGSGVRVAAAEADEPEADDLDGDRPPPAVAERRKSLSQEEVMEKAEGEFKHCLAEATRWLAKADRAAQQYHASAAGKERRLAKQLIEDAEASEGRVALPPGRATLPEDAVVVSTVDAMASTITPLLDKLKAAPAVGQCIVAEEEVVQRLVFEADALVEAREQAAVAGDVDGVEKLYQESLGKHELLQQARERVVEAFNEFEAPLSADLDSLTKVTRDRFRGTRMDTAELLTTAAKQNEGNYQLTSMHFTETETAKHLARRDLQAKKLEAIEARETAAKDIGAAVSKLQRDIEEMRSTFRKGAYACSDYVTVVAAVGELDSELLEIKAKAEAARAGHAHVADLLGTEQQRFEVLCLEAQAQLKGAEGDVIDRRNEVFSRNLDLRAKHYDGYRQTYLLLGDVQLKRSLQLAAVQAKVHRQVELLEDRAASLDPSAKEHAVERDRLEAIAAELAAKVGGLTDRMLLQSEAPAITQSRQLLLGAGRMLADPEEEFLALKARSDQKLLDYYQDREENGGEGDPGSPSVAALPASPHEKLLQLEQRGLTTSGTPTLPQLGASGAVRQYTPLDNAAPSPSFDSHLADLPDATPA